MKTNLLAIFTAALLLSPFARPAVAATADTNPPPRLTVELRDGSRVVGQSVEKNFKFHSALLGEIKLAVNAIRTVDCVTTNSAILATTDDDTLTVSFVDSDFAIKTSFGKVELAVDSIRKFTVSVASTSGPRHEGLVALWSGEGNANDSIGANNGVVAGGATFVAGKMGQAFSLDGTSGFVFVPASPSLDVGLSSGFTIESWINPVSTATRRPIVEWNNGRSTGVHFWISVDYIGGLSVGSLYANIVDSSDGFHGFASNLGIVTTNQFQHVALTYDKNSGVGKLYLNGLMVAQQNLGSFTPQTSYNFYLGYRPSEPLFWFGLLDEVSLYSRALSATEIRADYEAGNNN